jgi:hypothetical protein
VSRASDGMIGGLVSGVALAVQVPIASTFVVSLSRRHRNELAGTSFMGIISIRKTQIEKSFSRVRGLR